MSEPMKHVIKISSLVAVLALLGGCAATVSYTHLTLPTTPYV